MRRFSLRRTHPNESFSVNLRHASYYSEFLGRKLNGQPRCSVATKFMSRLCHISPLTYFKAAVIQLLFKLGSKIPHLGPKNCPKDGNKPQKYHFGIALQMPAVRLKCSRFCVNSCGSAMHSKWLPLSCKLWRFFLNVDAYE